MKKNNGGFTWKTVIGLTQFKRQVSRNIGIPMTKVGRQRKAGTGNFLAIIATLILDK